MTDAALIYPHQLFADHPALAGVARAVMVEEPLLFTQLPFQRKKLILHRATMKRYAKRPPARGVRVHYVDAGELAETGNIVDALRGLRIGSVRYVHPCDDWLATRLAASLEAPGVGPRVPLICSRLHMKSGLGGSLRAFLGPRSCV